MSCQDVSAERALRLHRQDLSNAIHQTVSLAGICATCEGKIHLTSVHYEDPSVVINSSLLLSSHQILEVGKNEGD